MGARAVAILKGEKFFSTGRLCVRGHIAKRRTNTGRCTDCELQNSRRVTREYRAAYYQKNKKKMNRASTKSKIKHREKVRRGQQQWREKNKKKIKVYNARWERENQGKANARTARRRAALLTATPPWLTRSQHEEMQNIYRDAIKKILTVDHIIPLKSETVCGLHVPWNLQLLSKSENCSKGNRYNAEEADCTA